MWKPAKYILEKLRVFFLAVMPVLKCHLLTKTRLLVSQWV